MCEEIVANMGLHSLSKLKLNPNSFDGYRRFDSKGISTGFYYEREALIDLIGLWVGFVEERLN